MSGEYPRHAGREAAEVERFSALIAAAVSRPWTLMEVCGTHTVNIHRFGLKSLLPPQLRLVSGPGCPVCVTGGAELQAAFLLASRPDFIICSFGDMLRVPSRGRCLLDCRDAGQDIRMLFSPLEALELARENPRKQVVFLAAGFETTAPLTASVLQLAAQQGVGNLSIIPAHKTMPAALTALLSGSPRISGLLCPGHVAAITGAIAFEFVPQRLRLPAVIAGFGAAAIMRAVYELVLMLEQGRVELLNCHPEVVRDDGNRAALDAMREVFCPADVLWRGLGMIPGSGLGLCPAYASFDAMTRFDVELDAAAEEDTPGCRCDAVLRGEILPPQCPLFAAVCAPESPVGACMVSSEGSCAAFYRFR